VTVLRLLSALTTKHSHILNLLSCRIWFVRFFYRGELSFNTLVSIESRHCPCIGHVRGGSENGRQWYEEPNGGKLLCKKNTFHDFVDVARWLIDTRALTSPDRLSCEGLSAGGLLVAASALNEAPELSRAALMIVPYHLLTTCQCSPSLNL
jgi:protease II